jgi:hypothetical protein
MTTQQWPKSLIEDYKALLKSGGDLCSHLISSSCELVATPFSDPIIGKDSALRFLSQTFHGTCEVSLDMSSCSCLIWRARQTDTCVDFRITRSMLLIMCVNHEGKCKKISAWRIQRVEDEKRANRLAGALF